MVGKDLISGYGCAWGREVHSVFSDLPDREHYVNELTWLAGQ
jgi:hypothetical protein